MNQSDFQSKLSLGNQSGVHHNDDNTSHLKGKLANLNETVRQLTENLNVHKKEV